MSLKRNPKDIHRIMGMMVELELKISEFYRVRTSFGRSNPRPMPTKESWPKKSKR
jgi:hypothetical protein